MNTERARLDKRGRIIGVVFLLSVCLWPVDAQANCSQRDNQVVCYYEINSRTDTALRVVDILLAEDDFTELILRRLLDQLRSKYSEQDLQIFVYSKVEQYQESQLGDTVRKGSPPKVRRLYAGAILILQGPNKIIRYNLPGGQRRTIVVAGVDPMEPR